MYVTSISWLDGVRQLVGRPVFAICLVVVATGCRTQEPVKQASPTPRGEVSLEPHSPKLAYITVEPVVTRTTKVIAVLPAQLVLDENHTVRVFSPVTGRISRLVVQPGDRVERGQPLAYILSGDAAQATSDVVRAQAAGTLAASALRRAEDLYAHHVIASKELEQARSDDAQAQAELARAQARSAQLGTSSGTVGGFVLRAPLAGEIVDRTANPGAEVRPDAQAPLFTVSSLGTLWLTAAAYQRDLANIHQGQQLVFTTDAAPGRRFVGTVSYVGGALDPQTRTVTLRATLNNADHALRAQTFGEARLFAPDEGHTPVIPTAAIVTHGASTVVFVEVAPGRFVRRDVTVADDDGTNASIKSGLNVGDRVVTRGSILLAGQADAGDAQ